MDVEVRTARPEELDAAGAAVRAAYESDGLGTAWYLDVVGDARARAGDADVLVAVDGAGQVLGTATFAVPPSPWAEVARPGEAEFRMLGVAPAARGRGVGEALVRACVGRAREAGAHRVAISTEVSMRSAHRLYERLGFTRRPDLDWQPVPEVQLLGYALEL